MKDEDQQSRVFHELSSMIIHILKLPPLPIPFTIRTSSSSASASTSRQPAAASPTAFASLFLGISLALMLFGSVTFAIGFVLMPLVMGLVLLFYALEILFNLSELGRSILFPASSPRHVSAAFREYDAHGY
ncbi:uncharacterized protein LOC21394073 isoform X1 [Morus notabilis]|uniref:uncharacterized protein LOC21394073 isoform X1 n=1 Tax=Morus notabilis TaxID=981085 RepID=UPI000CED53A8|nr:uncharacterized protein LOC21394073 isoform X1 [Morus notabilis]